MRSAPLRSIDITGGSRKGKVSLPPETFEDGESYLIEKRKLKIYPDRSGKYSIPREWGQKGVILYFCEAGGRNEDSYVNYRLEADCSKEADPI